MKRPRQYLEHLSEKVDLPRTVLAGLPQIEINGFGEVSVDLQHGLVAYSDEQIIVSVSLGQVEISGTKLSIRLMKEGKLIVVGEISGIVLHRRERT